MQAGQQINPAPHRIHRDLDLASEIRLDQLLRASFSENLHQGLQGPDLGYLRRLHAGLPATVVPGGGTAIGAKNGGRGGEKAQVILRSPTARPILPTRFEPVVESAPRQSVHP
ncbi:MAG: hypothetical protein DMG38_22820 [Acidobacteria bacterium]|nr:MAG: hypothetical protein DMG38_22820 [Acidobacteriota bacterium]